MHFPLAVVRDCKGVRQNRDHPLNWNILSKISILASAARLIYGHSLSGWPMQTGRLGDDSNRSTGIQDQNHKRGVKDERANQGRNCCDSRTDLAS